MINQTRTLILPLAYLQKPISTLSFKILRMSYFTMISPTNIETKCSLHLLLPSRNMLSPCVITIKKTVCNF